MTKPIRIQRKRTAGFNLQAESKARNGLDCVYVGRPGRFGNPFKVGDFVTFPDNGIAIFWQCWERKHVTPAYKELKTIEDVLEAYQKYFDRVPKGKFEKLRGRNLACWCREDAEFCHADVILEYLAKL